jgi:nucleoside-diphosphate-sugar epimerase
MSQAVLVTGATGFIGGALLRRLRDLDIAGRGAVRRVPDNGGTQFVGVGNILGNTDWDRALDGVETVVHLAARAHVLKEAAADPLEAFRAVNVEGTKRLAEAAARRGVRRFVFVSSIGVLGIHTNGRGPFSMADVPAPVEDYAISKLEAEHALWTVARSTGLELVIVRPPLVYGPGARGNFARLLDLVRSGFPLPLRGVRNLRSLVALDNLVDLLISCIRHPAAAGQTLLVSDGEDLSTPELIQRMARAMNRPARLFWFPPRALHAAAALLGRGGALERLTGSLQVDIGHTSRILGWAPPLSVDEGLSRAVAS